MWSSRQRADGEGDFQGTYSTSFPLLLSGAQWMWWTQPQTPLRGFGTLCILAIHCFQLNQLPCKHMGNCWVFLFSCRSIALNNIQNDSATYHPMLAKIRSPALFSPTPRHFPLHSCGRMHTDEKDQIHNGAILKRFGCQLQK